MLRTLKVVKKFCLVAKKTIKPRQLLVADQNWTGDAMNLQKIKMKFGDAIL